MLKILRKAVRKKLEKIKINIHVYLESFSLLFSIVLISKSYLYYELQAQIGLILLIFGMN